MSQFLNSYYTQNVVIFNINLLLIIYLMSSYIFIYNFYNILEHFNIFPKISNIIEAFEMSTNLTFHKLK